MVPNGVIEGRELTLSVCCVGTSCRLGGDGTWDEQQYQENMRTICSSKKMMILSNKNHSCTQKQLC